MRIGGRQSSNIEDRRGMGGPLLVGGGGVGAIVIALLVYFLRGTPGDISNRLPQQQTPPGQTAGAPSDPQALFVSNVLADTEDVWHDIFQKEVGRDYQEPKLVLFTDVTQSGCGVAQSSMGPFYCPLDHKVYIDLGFYRDLKDRFGAPGDFAQAYVIAHEVGHHVQTLLGITDQVEREMQRSSRTRRNQISVMNELQADCYAGVWANHAQKMKNILEPGDIDEALNAASAIGDDRLQKETQGRVVPESFTHGTSQQRARWFRQGFQTGEMKQCDTFNAPSL
ncbi:MAG: KPN_02809 family neutral zinc metallopeptidase [Thermoanaerobaculia bacterium]